MTIRKQTQPNTIGQPVVNFEKDSFESLIWNKGYRVLLESARQCPCRGQQIGSPLLSCKNCRGTGWFFINPIETRVLVSNINKSPKYVEWTEESVGTISASLRYVDRVGEMDRITFLDGYSKRSEKLLIREEGGEKFVFLTYKPNEIVDVFYSRSASEKLVKMPISDYSIDTENPYILLVDLVPPTGFNSIITVTYTCNPTYHVIDLPKDLRNSTFVNNLGQIEKINLPVNVILRKSQHIIKSDFGDGGVKINDNSYL